MSPIEQVLDDLEWSPIDNSARDGTAVIVRDQIGQTAAASWDGSKRRDSRDQWLRVTRTGNGEPLTFAPAYFSRERVEAFVKVAA